MNDIIEYMESQSAYALENANDLFKQYGDTHEYFLKRLEFYEDNIGNHFWYDGREYKIIEASGKMITIKRCRWLPYRKPSGRIKWGRIERFAITSNRDLLIKVLYKNKEVVK